MEQDLIITATHNLNEITAELEALLRICSRETGLEGNKMNKARKRKWLVEKSDIQKLLQRMNQANEALHFSLDLSRVSSDVRFQAEMRWMITGGVQQQINNFKLIIQSLLDLWKNMLSEVGLPRRAAFAATNSLKSDKLNDNETYLVRRILSFSRDSSEVTTTKVHDATLHGANLQKALEEQPWAISTIDDTGEYPLILAARKSQARSMELLISAGADVNQQSYNGWTPLMAAVMTENLQSVKLLLESRCSVDLCSHEGTTALQLASQKPQS
ncbi:ankyrin repeat PH and SEC7 domain protein [Fusarium beomiforme]|uniref:Ankyrin repeat PH and SEC7 domain protein n=1 Tax=Fusarium beomiforme TaxID=44412 RepID=A0A9P5A774_9HYPO|nr:ankyrin repeat PH and SEC7 domain protein [Fusarium beomiforme]